MIIEFLVIFTKEKISSVKIFTYEELISHTSKNRELPFESEH